MQGLNLKNARIVNDLDLSFVTLRFPLNFEGSQFVKLLKINGARVPRLDLRRAHVSDIRGEGIEVTGSIFLDNLRSDGEVNLAGATIGGYLSAKGGTYNTKSLHGAKIGGDLDADSSRFVNAAKRSLDADDMRVTGYVFLRNPLVKGDVSLLGANIGQNLEASGAEFLNPGAEVLIADRAVVNGNVSLDNGFYSQGPVNLRGAEIRGTLDCGDGRFENTPANGKSSGTVLNISGTRVGGNVLLNDVYNRRALNAAPGQVIFRNDFPDFQPMILGSVKTPEGSSAEDGSMLVRPPVKSVSKYLNHRYLYGDADTHVTVELTGSNDRNSFGGCE